MTYIMSSLNRSFSYGLYKLKYSGSDSYYEFCTEILIRSSNSCLADKRAYRVCTIINQNSIDTYVISPKCHFSTGIYPDILNFNDVSFDSCLF